MQCPQGVDVVRSPASVDVNGDGTVDPVSIVRCTAVTSGFSWRLLVTDGASAADRPVLLATVPPVGDRTDILEVFSFGEGDSGDFVLQARGRSAQAPNCCADQRVTYDVAWDGSALAVRDRSVLRELDGPADSGSFTTPSGNIGCSMHTTQVECTVKEHTWTAPPNPAPDDGCEWGRAIGIADGQAQYMCSDSPIPGPVQAYGTTVVKGPFTCEVAEQGVICWQEGGAAHFFVSREQAQLGP